MKSKMRPVHPGEILREEFLVPMDLSANKLAQAIGVPANRITELVAENRSITADTALRLAAALDTTAEFWMNLQKSFELRTAEREVGSTLRAIKPVRKVG